MTSPSQRFTSGERAIAFREITNNPGIGISKLAKMIGRSKAAAEVLREEVRLQIRPHDLLQSRAGEIEFSIDRLFPHPFNTRIIDPGAADIAALASEIERNGQLEPLIVTSAPDSQSNALVIDGIRRAAALRRLQRTTAKVVFVQLTLLQIAATFNRVIAHSDDCARMSSRCILMPSLVLTRTNSPALRQCR